MRRFARERRAGQFQIQTFDKSNDRVFATAIENVAVELDFNALDQDGGRISLEAGMGQIESGAAGALAGVIERGALAGMTLEDRAAIDLFCALQFVRGTGPRAQFAAMAEAVTERVRAMAGEDGVRNLGLDGPDGLKRAALGLVVGSLREFTAHFNDKDLLLFEAPPGHEMLLGDNPVTLQNDRDLGPYGNLGLGVPGIEIYMSISSRLSLGYWCPTKLQQMREGVALAERGIAQARAMMVVGNGAARDRALAVLPELEARRARLGRAPDGHLAGTAIAMTPENVVRLNSLQARWAERFVMSRDGNFDIVRRMIADDPAVRRGMRPRID